MASDVPIVWVLGAGFSAPLGGPMLADLLSLESREDIAEAHALVKNDPGVFWLYHYGRKFKDGWLGGESNFVGENLWQDAEDFLDKLDTAVLSSGRLAARLNAILHKSPTQYDVPDGYKSRLHVVRHMARRYVAAECGEFVRRSDPNSEQWQPHRAWMLGLEGTDVVITFNYDRVLRRSTTRSPVRIRAPILAISCGSSASGTSRIAREF